MSQMKKFLFDWVSLSTNHSFGFVWVCLINVSQFLVIESNKTSVSFIGLTMSKFIELLYFLVDK